jgi:hypothetical protein
VEPVQGTTAVQRPVALVTVPGCPKVAHTHIG